MNIYLGKSQGPPYGKLGKKKFKKPADEPSENKILKYLPFNKAHSPISESHDHGHGTAKPKTETKHASPSH